MKPVTRRFALTLGLGLLAGLTSLQVGAQFPFPGVPPQTPMAQRNALNTVLSSVSWLQSATRSAPSFATGGYGLVFQRFGVVRAEYSGLKSTLTEQQLTAGANQVAELDAGLDIIEQAFTDYQTEVANGQSSLSALHNMCQVVNKAIGLWARELKRDCRQLRVGW
jgi:hypothetical protein